MPCSSSTRLGCRMTSNARCWIQDTSLGEGAYVGIYMCDPCAGFIGPGWIHEAFSRLALCADELCRIEFVEGSFSP
jgi:hypothetical protein